MDGEHERKVHATAIAALILTYHANNSPNQPRFLQVWPCQGDGSVDLKPKLAQTYVVLVVLLNVDWSVVEVNEMCGCTSRDVIGSVVGSMMCATS